MYDKRELETDLLRQLASVYRTQLGHRIIGREAESAEIKAFIESSLEETSGLLYVCGKPGQGKTAVVTSILDEFESDLSTLILRYNAMAFSDL